MGREVEAVEERGKRPGHLVPHQILILRRHGAAACLLPWAVRNKVELGTFILTRSNFGLELATGNAPGATGVSGSGSGRSLHPHDSIAAAAHVQSVGEVASMQRMTEQAEAWIIADPARFLRLAAARVRLAFFPSKAIVGWVPGMGMEWPWVLCMVFGALRVAALIGAVLFRIRPVSIALYTFLPLAPYFINPRPHAI
ncbi:MAG TPA: hypothetical protein VHY76_04840 [Acetobacteraceae bacterium]|nr:hypothetical protein [Acetobacteraceae bacterium]